MESTITLKEKGKCLDHFMEAATHLMFAARNVQAAIETGALTVPDVREMNLEVKNLSAILDNVERGLREKSRFLNAKDALHNFDCARGLDL